MPQGIPLRRLELCGCRLGATGAGHLATALRATEGKVARGAVVLI